VADPHVPVDQINARFYPIFADMERAVQRHDLRAGENIYILTVLLLGSIQDAPADIRELFRGAAVQALLRERGAGGVLKALCLDGKIKDSSDV
jgi:hypothetical protein